MNYKNLFYTLLTVLVCTYTFNTYNSAHASYIEKQKAQQVRYRAEAQESEYIRKILEGAKRDKWIQVASWIKEGLDEF